MGDKKLDWVSGDLGPVPGTIWPKGSLIVISGTCEGTLTMPGNLSDTVGTDYLEFWNVLVPILAPELRVLVVYLLSNWVFEIVLLSFEILSSEEGLGYIKD